MKKLILLLVCGFVLICVKSVSAEQGALKLKIDAKTAKSEAFVVDKAIASFQRICPGIRKYSGDLSQGEAVKMQSANLTDERELGWKKSVSIGIVVSDSPRIIPSNYKATGHHCHFAVGVSAPFGVSISKRPCIAICLDKKSDENFLFIPAQH